MAYDFKRLSEVELEEEMPEEANLLIEIEDEIKRAPFPKIDTDKFDVVIKCDTGMEWELTLLKGSFEECVSRITNFEPISIVLVYNPGANGEIYQLLPSYESGGVKYSPYDSQFRFNFSNADTEDLFTVYFDETGLSLG